MNRSSAHDRMFRHPSQYCFLPRPRSTLALYQDGTLAVLYNLAQDAAEQEASEATHPPAPMTVKSNLFETLMTSRAGSRADNRLFTGTLESLALPSAALWLLVSMTPIRRDDEVSPLRGSSLPWNSPTMSTRCCLWSRLLQRFLHNLLDDEVDSD